MSRSAELLHAQFVRFVGTAVQTGVAHLLGSKLNLGCHGPSVDHVNATLKSMLPTLMGRAISPITKRNSQREVKRGCDGLRGEPLILHRFYT